MNQGSRRSEEASAAGGCVGRWRAGVEGGSRRQVAVFGSLNSRRRTR
ncbi:hypothetical protein HanRHA438_Chr08g0351271 [Helianthus annuus]|nr:hypothetical protein HanIR_Chr08g0367091 [Helianthus annuus]KAJ0897942.1 hypothetical protein HanRHA438_Chr08g0351271 [Helianthus annuus]